MDRQTTTHPVGAKKKPVLLTSCLHSGTPYQARLSPDCLGQQPKVATLRPWLWVRAEKQIPCSASQVLEVRSLLRSLGSGSRGRDTVPS